MFVVLILCQRKVQTVKSQVSMDTNKWITEVNDGVEVELDNDAKVIEGDWTLLITLPEPCIPTSFTTALDTIESYLFNGMPGAFNMPKEQANYIQRLQAIRRQAVPHSPWWHTTNTDSPLHSRQRRGQLNAIGNAFQWLFGTATDEDVQDIQRQMADMEYNQELIAIDFKRFTSILDYSRIELNVTRHKVNELVKQYNELVNLTTGIQANLSLISKILLFKSHMSVLFYNLDNFLHQFHHIYNDWLNRKANVEAGRLTENILPPALLQQVLQTATFKRASIIEPIQWYYEHVQVIPLWNRQTLVYKVRLPVVHLDNWHHITFRTWPIPLGEQQAELQLPSELLRNTRTGELDLSPTCYGARPLVCRRGLLTNGITYPCLTQLLAAAPKYANECIISITNHIPLDVVIPRMENEYMLTTMGAQLHLRCATQAEQLFKAKAGVYKLHVPYPCTVKTETWSLTATYERTLNITIYPKLPMFNVEITFSTIMNDNVHALQTLAELDPLKPIDVTDITLDMLYRVPRKIQKRSFSYDWFYFFFSLIPIFGVAMYTLAKYTSTLNRFSKFCPSKTLTTDNRETSPERSTPVHEPEIQKVDASAPTPSPTPHIFQFIGGSNQPPSQPAQPSLIYPMLPNTPLSPAE